jgi:glycine cleavage system aminomethyltransferase T
MPDYGVAVLRSPLHAWHVERNAKLADWSRWLVPTAYSDPEQEADAARSGVALADLCAFTRLRLQGPDVPALTWALTSESPAMHASGVATFLAAGEGLACRLTDDELLLLCSTAHSEGMVQYLNKLCAGQRAVLIDVTSGLAEFCLIGPSGLSLLSRLTALDLGRSLPPACCAATSVAGVHATLVRVPQSAVVRLCVPWDVAEFVWELLFELGREFGIVAVGLEAVKAFVPLGYP